MNITFDVGKSRMGLDPLTFDASGVHPWGGDLTAVLERHGHKITFVGLRFGIVVKSDGVEIRSKSWPPEGVKYTRTDQDVILSERIRWTPDDNITIETFVENGGERYDAIYYLTAPRPAQPYPSWTWDDVYQKWTAPVAYPTDGQDYVWDEPAGAWVNDQA